MSKALKITLSIFILIVTAIFFSYSYLPVNRVGITSELVMLGDLNNDSKWDDKDQNRLEEILVNPFLADNLTQLKMDINKNGLIDKEDIVFLEHIYKFPNPYEAEDVAKSNNIYYPKPRELFHYLPKYEYIQRPLFHLHHKVIAKSPFLFLKEIKLNSNRSTYNKHLLNEIYNEAVRFSFAFDIRKNKVTSVEKRYVQKKIRYCNDLYTQQKYYELLLNLISLVEDVETLTTTTQSNFLKRILYFRDNLKHLLTSDEFISYSQGKTSYLEIFKKMQTHLKSDLNISLELQSLDSPRDFTDLQNYLDRGEWQIFKSKTKKEHFKSLVLYVQYDRRYLRAVSKTSPKMTDIQLQNHNLPMILLFREALKISHNDKKAALGLLDESVRIPMGWVKNIPKDVLPSSIALENFLLPGNKEDGSDKTRHWNVFGGLAIYKSPKDSLILALKREIIDLKAQEHSALAMQEFIRDTIANINGIYYVVSINSNLLVELQEQSDVD